MMQRTLAVIVLLGVPSLSGCYRSHGRGAVDAGRSFLDAASGRDAAGADAGDAMDARAPIDAAPIDAAPIDAGPIDAGPIDAGPPRPLRWIALAEGSAERPPGRYAHFAVYDEASDRTLILGGFDPYGDRGGCCLPEYVHHRDVWALDAESDQWTRLAELDQTLVAANAVTATLDAARRRIVLIGALEGWDVGRPRNVAIDLDRFTVTRLPDGPWPRGSAPLRTAYDASARRIVVHGAYYADLTEGVWAFDLTTDTWSTPAIADPPPLRFHTPLVAGRGGVSWMFGGYDGDRFHADLWMLDTALGRWTAVPLSGDVIGRSSHRMIAEPSRGILAAFGGSRWTTHDRTVVIEPSRGLIEEPELDPAPPARRDATMVLDTRRRRAVLFGGAFESARAYDDAWGLELP